MDTIHVAYTVDVRGKGAIQFLDQLLCSIHSMRKNKSPESQIIVHVVYGNLPFEFISKLNSIAAPDFMISYFRLAESELNRLQKFSKHSPTSTIRSWGGIVYARLFLAHYLPNVDRILYLDSDTYINQPLDDLWNTDLQGKTLGMVMGNVPEYGYNSGVILMDLARMRSNPNLWKELDEHMQKHAITYYCPDQTVINRFFSDSILPMDVKFNYPPMPQSPNLNNMVIWHFYSQHRKPLRFDKIDLAQVKWNKCYQEMLRTFRP